MASNSLARKAVDLLSKSDRRKLFLISLFQVITNILDLIGVGIVGALGALSVQGLESRSPGNKVSVILRFLHIENLSFQTEIAVLGISAAMILIIKTIISALFNRKIIFFLSIKSSKLSGELFSRYISGDLIQVQSRPSQEILYIILEGVKNILVTILATSVTLVSDLFMLLIMGIGLFIFNAPLALFTIAIFSCLSFLLYKALHLRTRKYGQQMSTLWVQSNEKILELINGYRESVVGNRRLFYLGNIKNLMLNLANTSAELNFQPYISKYVVESASIFCAFLLATFEFATQSGVHAVSTLIVFMAASSRIAPAALRIQQGILTLKSSAGSTETTFSLIDYLKEIPMLVTEDEIKCDFSYSDFVPHISIRDINFKYPTSQHFSLLGVSLEIPEGSSVAIVGPSGAGKTTLVDLILGVLAPNSGEVLLSGKSPLEAFRTWPGAISYLPQNVVVASGTIRSNVGLGYEKQLITDLRVWEALKLAQLESLVSSLPNGLETVVGEHGSRLSGGQRQRIGIARALFTKPKLVALDEATSALDGETESAISSAIQNLSGKTTVVIVAHRLSTVRLVDKIVYMEQGKIIATGTFDEVRESVPNFDKQALLMGL
jgi:ABC-type bacteriocin/lantibiotic exporter with double-glycine peptidase domain